MTERVVKSANLIDALVDKAEQRGIELWVEKEKLRFKAPAGAMTAALRTQLKSKKNDLITALSDGAPHRIGVTNLLDFRRKTDWKKAPSDRHSAWIGHRSAEIGVDSTNRPHNAV